MVHWKSGSVIRETGSTRRVTVMKAALQVYIMLIRYVNICHVALHLPRVNHRDTNYAPSCTDAFHVLTVGYFTALAEMCTRPVILSLSLYADVRVIFVPARVLEPIPDGF